MKYYYRRAIYILLALAAVTLFAVGGIVKYEVDHRDPEPGVLIRLPSNLHFVIEPALKYGCYQFPDEIAAFAASARPTDREALAHVREQLAHQDFEDIALFFDTYPITDYPESAKLYFLLNVIDGVLGAVPYVEPTREEQLRDSLKSLSRFGSKRLASNRMFAAQWFCRNPPIPREALPLLMKACDDPSFRVRVWAHGALASADGESDRHIHAIKQVIAQVLPTSEEYPFIGEDAEMVVELVRARERKFPD